MSHFAKVVNGIVTEVHVAEWETLQSGLWGDPSFFVQTSYNTKGGVHLTGGTPLRKNYAGIGYTYDAVRDAFYAPKPYSSWILNEDTCYWESPVPIPADANTGEPPKFYEWDEATTSWVLKSNTTA
jgi:hypothetical protein